MEQTFTKIYENKLWGNNNNSVYSGSSGTGSAVEYNKDSYLIFLKKFIIEHNIKTIVDLGNGDFRCGYIYDDLDIQYTGYDAYKKVQDYNATQYPKPKYTFNHLDFCANPDNITNGDLCILKDVLQHWTLNSINSFLDNITTSKKFKYILIVNCAFQQSDNPDIHNGEFRALSCDFLPLKKYNIKKLYNYHTKEVSVIT